MVWQFSLVYPKPSPPPSIPSHNETDKGSDAINASQKSTIRNHFQLTLILCTHSLASSTLITLVWTASFTPYIQLFQPISSHSSNPRVQTSTELTHLLNQTYHPWNRTFSFLMLSVRVTPAMFLRQFTCISSNIQPLLSAVCTRLVSNSFRRVGTTTPHHTNLCSLPYPRGIEF